MALYRLILTGLSPASQRALSDAIAARMEQFSAVEVFSAPDLSQPRADLYHVIAEDNRFERIRDLQLLLEKLGCEACVVDETSSFARVKDHGRNLVRLTKSVARELRQQFDQGELWNPGRFFRRLRAIPSWVWLVVALSSFACFALALMLATGPDDEDRPGRSDPERTSSLAELGLDGAEQHGEIDRDDSAPETPRTRTSGEGETPREAAGSVRPEQPSQEDGDSSRRWIFALVCGLSISVFGGFFVPSKGSARSGSGPLWQKWPLVVLFVAIFSLIPAAILLFQEPPRIEQEQVSQPGLAGAIDTAPQFELPVQEGTSTVEGSQTTAEPTDDEIAAAAASVAALVDSLPVAAVSPCAGIELEFQQLLCELERRYPASGLAQPVVSPEQLDAALVELGESGVLPDADLMPSVTVGEEAPIAAAQLVDDAPAGEEDSKPVGPEETDDALASAAAAEPTSDAAAEATSDAAAEATSDPRDAATGDPSDSAPRAEVPSQGSRDRPDDRPGSGETADQSSTEQGGSHEAGAAGPLDSSLPEGQSPTARSEPVPAPPEAAQPDSNSPSEDDRSTIASLLDEVTKADVASFEIGFFLGLFATIAWRRRGVLSDDA